MLFFLNLEVVSAVPIATFDSCDGPGRQLGRIVIGLDLHMVANENSRMLVLRRRVGVFKRSESIPQRRRHFLIFRNLRVAATIKSPKGFDCFLTRF